MRTNVSHESSRGRQPLDSHIKRILARLATPQEALEYDVVHIPPRSLNGLARALEQHGETIPQRSPVERFRVPSKRAVKLKQLGPTNVPPPKGSVRCGAHGSVPPP